MVLPESDEERQRRELLKTFGKVSPEVDTLIQRVLQQPRLSDDPKEIKKWARRIAEDVADLRD